MSDGYKLEKAILADDSRMIKEEWFKNHKAKLIAGPANVIEWRNPSTINYSMYITIFDRYITFIGDLGSAVFDLTWKPTPFELPPQDLSYVLGKMDCCSDTDLWSEKLASSYINEYLEQKYLTKKQTDLLFEALQSGKEDYQQAVRRLYDSSNLETEIISSIFTFGFYTHPRKQSYLIGWTMAVEQLIANK